MRTWIGFAVLGMGLLACSSSDGDSGQGGGGTPSLVGNWIYVNEDATAGLGATFNGDGTYTVLTLFLTSSNSADAEVETGAYSVSGKTITATPQQWTCPGPDPVSTLQHSFGSSGNLLLTTSSGVISLERNKSTASDDFVIRFGCYDRKTNAFTPSQLAPVAN